MAVRSLLLATESGLGNGETPIFPIQIFRVKTGVSFNEGDPNFDLFQLACRVSSKRLFPNFSFLDAPFNAKYYVPGRPETEIAYMGCRTRVIGNAHDPGREISNGRGNLSFTTINLPRIAIKSRQNIPSFFSDLEGYVELVIKQLMERFKIQCGRKVRNYPFLMGQGIWLDSETLGWDEEVASVLGHGTLSVGFIGLAEALKALTGCHHGESEASQALGLDIVRFMRQRLDRETEATKLNFTLLATPAEGLSGRFVRLDAAEFGTMDGVTDREYYTNSFHVPVYHKITAAKKIAIEAPYHELTNAGHITYVELDGDASSNPEAFERIVRFMAKSGVGYGSINHLVDRDPVCGYNGLIGDRCPKCGRAEGEGGGSFDRIRRITGYLVGTVERFNNAKRAEERDRVKHAL
jgi:ribonucleoside-triphosphate reductase